MTQQHPGLQNRAFFAFPFKKEKEKGVEGDRQGERGERRGEVKKRGVFSKLRG